MSGLHEAASLDDVRRDHPHVRVVGAARHRRDAIAAFYRAVDAPGWASPNLDGLADVLGDLGWLPAGAVALAWIGAGALDDADRQRLLDVLGRATLESAGTEHPLSVYVVAATP